MLRELRYELKAKYWKERGRNPHAAGWNAAKWIAVRKSVAGQGDGRYGFDDAGIDERVVEYPWLFDRLRTLRSDGERVLDAGSILNHEPILEAWRRQDMPPVSIVTLAHEGRAFVSDTVRYEFADLRALPYRDELFSIVLCVSTLEHVGLDTRVYGGVKETSDPATEAIKALQELSRVTRRGGVMLLTVPFGASSRREWLRIFDSRDLAHVVESSAWEPTHSRYFRAKREGWRECSEGDAAGAGYNEPNAVGGKRTAPDFVAAAEAVALIELRRP